MKNSRLIAVALTLVAALSACKKENAAGGAGGAQTAAGGAAGGLNVLPKDSDIVIGLNFQKLKSSALFKKYEATFTQSLGGKLEELKASCGADPVAHLDSVHIGIKSADKTFVAVVHGLDKKIAGDCVKKQVEKEKAKGETAEALVEDNYIEIKGKDGTVGLLFLDDKTFVTGGKDEKGLTKAELEPLVKQGSANSVAGSKEFMELIGKTDTTDPLWMVASGNSEMLQKAPMKFQAVFGSLEVTDSIKFEGAGRMTSDADAQKAAADLKGQVDAMKQSPMGGMLGEITVNQTGPEVQIRVVMTQQQIDAIAGMVQGMMGQMGQMGGGAPPAPEAPPAPPAPAAPEPK